jgi:hypothetical protein
VATTQIEIKIRPDVFYKIWHSSKNVDQLSIETEGEIYGYYTSDHYEENVAGGIFRRYFGGRTAFYQPVYSINSNTFTIGGITQGEQTEFIKSAIIGVEITGIQQMHKSYHPYTNKEQVITGTANWEFPSVIDDYIDSYGTTEMYPTCEKALLGKGAIVQSKIETIELDDVWNNQVYLAFPMTVSFGCDVDHQPLLGQSLCDSFTYQSEWSIWYDLTFRVVTVYSEPIDTDVLPKDIFDEELDKGGDFQFFAWIIHWLANSWRKIGGKILIVLLGSGVIIIIGYVIIRRGQSGKLGKLLEKGSTNTTSGGKGGGATNVTVNVRNVMKTVRKKGGKVRDKVWKRQ